MMGMNIENLVALYFNYQNPREASSRSRILLFSLVYVFMYVIIYLFVSRLLAKRKTIQT